MNKKRKFIIKECFILLTSIFLAYTIFSSFFAIGRSSDVSIRIEATGEKNPNSFGTDVRIQDFLINGEPISRELLYTDYGWEIMDESITILDPPKSVSLYSNIKNAETLEIRFAKQLGSGFVNIYIDGEHKERLDLYSEEWDIERWSINLYNISILSHLDRFLLLFLIISELFFLIKNFCHFVLRAKKNITDSAVIFMLAFCFFSMIYFLYICNFKFEELNFFSEGQSVSTWYVFHVILLVQGMLLISLLKQKKFRSLSAAYKLPYINHLLIQIFLIAGWSFFLLAGVELLNNSKAFYFLTTPSIICTIFLLVALLAVIYSITQHIFLSGCIISVILYLHAVVNYYVLLFRDEVIMPTDILVMGTALNVASKYSLRFCAELFMCAAFFMCACGFLFVCHNMTLSSFSRRLWKNALMFILGIGYIVCINKETVQNAVNISTNSWKRVLQCREEGFLLTYFTTIEKLFPHKPKTYSKEKLRNLFNTYQTDEIDNMDTFPNVIVIMNESFSDLEEFNVFSSSEPLEPFLHSLRGKSNTLYGYVQVPVMGGGTSNTEFEFLTGTNAWAYPSTSPYDTLITSDTHALPSIMEKLGYETIALHPEIAHNWSRNKAYPRLGFQQFIDREQMENRELVRDYISDESFYEEIKKIISETEEPLFLFGITMQNHGGYEYENFEEPVQIQEPKGDYPLATQYINLVKQSDQAFERFISYCETIDRPTIVIFFGDHFPAIESEFLSQISAPYQTGTEQDRLLMYHTPYYIWANFAIDKEKSIGENKLVSVSFFQSEIMNIAGLPKTGYQKFLSDISRNYPVVSPFCIIKADDCLSDKDESFLDDYTILQYTLLRGNDPGMYEFFDFN